MAGNPAAGGVLAECLTFSDYSTDRLTKLVSYYNRYIMIYSAYMSYRNFVFDFGAIVVDVVWITVN